MAVNAQAMKSKNGGWLARFILAVGFLCVSLWVIGLISQVQTNEAFISHTGTVDLFRPEWDVLWQIPNLVMGNFTSDQGAAVLFGWGIEVIYLIFIAGYEAAHLAVHSASGDKAAGIFRTLSYGIIVFNGWTDYQYGSLGAWGHLGFALVLSFIVGFLGTIGMKFIEIGWANA